MTITFMLPLIGDFIFIGETPEKFLLFKIVATGRTMLLSRSQMPLWPSSREAKLVEPVTHHRDYWGRSEILITDDGSGWGH